MKYAIYDKAANGYLTDMDVYIVCFTDTWFTCAYTEYITNAKLLDTKKDATDAVARIENTKFMDKGRFVIHSFDDALYDQYIISEAGNPTKVVDNITVDLDGTINVKYGTMISHWSTISLNYAIDRMNALQKAVSAIYTSWNNTFDIYKVINIMDEKEHTHYQFVNVTITGLTKYEKEEEKEEKEELEKANYELGEQVAERGAVANRLLDENNSLKTKVESIKKEARDWKKLYENANRERNILSKKYYAYASKAIANNIVDICEADDEFNITLKKFSELYEAVNAVHNTDDDPIMYAFNSVLSIFSTINSKLENFADEIVSWKNKAQKAEKALEDKKKLNDANKATIAYLTIKKMAKDKELSDWKMRAEETEKSLNNQLELNHGVCDENHELRVARDCSAEIIHAIRNAIVDGNADAFDCIESRMRHDSDFNSDPFMAGVRENVKDICTAEKKNIANNDLKNSEITRLTEERDKSLEQKEFYKRQANSVYGMIIPGRCCGKQLTADILSGKKIPISKKKYDDLMECVNNISLTYEMMKLNQFSMDRPSWLSGVINRINNLTK